MNQKYIQYSTHFFKTGDILYSVFGIQFNFTIRDNTDTSLTRFADAGRGPGVAVEAVLMRGVGHVTLPEVPGVTVLVTGAGPQLTLARLSVTEVLSVTVTIVITLAGMVSQVTDGGGVLTV